MSAAEKIKKQETIADAARIALDRAKGDLRAATRILEQAVRRSARLREELTEPLLANACYDAVRCQIRRDRKTIWGHPVDATDQQGRVVALARGNLMLFPLPGGKLLRDATRHDVLEAAQFYVMQADNMLDKAKWLRLVWRVLPDEQRRVGDVLTEKQLAKLQAEARRAN